MNKSQLRRLWVVLIALIFATVIIVGRLFAFQIVQGKEWAERTSDEMYVIAQPERGVIYDRNGAVLAANGSDYQVSVSPNIVYDPEELSAALSSILQRPQLEIQAILQENIPYYMLEGRVSPEVADLIRTLPYDGVQVDPLPRRFYPQGELMCHILGYVDFDGNGGSGLEGYYQSDLAGEAAGVVMNISPLTSQESVIARQGSDLVLTIDRTVQYLVEQSLQRGVQEYAATGGTIIVMEPSTGAILAMASTPCFSPYNFYDFDEGLLLDPIVSKQYEPGSVMKLITMASALDSGTVTPQSTYYDAGVLEVGGHLTYNWDRSAPGTVDMTTLLARSLNVGAATLATWMGPETFYNYFQRFGFGKPTGIDLMAEIGGTMALPGSELWTDAQLATNAYGQGLATTPLQMITAVSALANKGYLMQPYLVQERRGPNGTFTHEPTVLSHPISEEAAQQVTTMAVAAVAHEVYEAQIDGYTIAGKTGTAQIPESYGYNPDDTIASFIGWLPADAPEIIVLVKLDRPQVSPWGSTTAAPLFAELAKELVVLLGIPPDNVRLQSDVTAARQQ
ncbi:MAG: penicillin-binding protein 2 [Ardenticatenaceae bacterium]|nr:penicillin-binding protein 2 [Anaerolineales bacterium]MCB8922320.1 penicillin-binding protein 2 [Ardenticatenaceae bacterium]MCB8990496.1 penicillin-binding protein 2 [Ardenticatenaceae bacterium]